MADARARAGSNGTPRVEMDDGCGASADGDRASDPTACPAPLRNVPAKVYALLKRLEVHQYADPWVSISTDGPVSHDHARFRIDDGGPARTETLSEPDLKHWSGYSLDLLGLRLHDDDAYRGLFMRWWGDDLILDVRYVCIRWHRRVTQGALWE